MSQFSDSITFKQHPEILFLQKEDKIFITTFDLQDKIYEIDLVAKEIFLLAINDFTYKDIISVCAQLGLSEGDVHEKIDSLLSDFITKQILLVNESQS
jgi:hypothetical protein